MSGTKYFMKIEENKEDIDSKVMRAKIAKAIVDDLRIKELNNRDFCLKFFG